MDANIFLWVLGAVLVAALGAMVAVPYVEARKRLNRAVVETFGVPRRRLTSSEADRVLRELAFQAGALLLVEEALQGQIDLTLLPGGAEADKIRVLFWQYRTILKEPIQAAVSAATRRLKDADFLLRRATGIVGSVPRRKEDGLVSIVALPPYKDAEWARAETKRREAQRRAAERRSR